MPANWDLYQNMMFADASTFLLYNQNMRQLTVDKLIDCEMIDADLCFERSEVEATLTAPVVSIKNPWKGTVAVPAVGELIYDEPLAAGVVKIGK